MKARIYQPTKNAMQSGPDKARTGRWLLHIESDDPRYIDPLMGWTGSKDTHQQLRLYFPTRQEAEEYARRKGMAYEIVLPHKRRHKPKSYADNFAFTRIMPFSSGLPATKNSSSS